MSASKRKGDGYEREVAKFLDHHLFADSNQVQRMPLSGGGSHIGGGGKADLLGTPTIWVEAKRTERFQPYEAMAQAERGIAASRSNDKPVVITRRNRIATEDSLVVMRMKDWLDLYASWISDIGHKTSYSGFDPDSAAGSPDEPDLPPDFDSKTKWIFEDDDPMKSM